MGIIILLFSLLNLHLIQAIFQNEELSRIFILNEFARHLDESTEEYCSRIFTRSEEETNKDYVKRIDTIYAASPELECKHNLEYWTSSENYYKLKYGSTENLSGKKTKNEYYATILKKGEGEDYETYIKRMDCVYQAYPRLDIWRKIQFDKDVKNWYFYRKVDYGSNIKPSLNLRENLVDKYSRRKEEVGDDYTYFKRICKRNVGETDQKYIIRIAKLEKYFKNLSLWHNTDYLELTKTYYVLKYKKGEKEELVKYYDRITHKSALEDLETYMRRLSLIEHLYSNLPIWNNEEYLQYTKNFYKAIYAKKTNEDDEGYLKRITTKTSYEVMDHYLKRINIIQWVNKGTELFYNEKYLSYTKSYFTFFYQKGSSESLDIWLGRLFKRHYEETDEEYVKRLTMVIYAQKDQINSNSEKYVEYASEYLKLLYKKKNEESKEAWLERIKTKTESETEETYQLRVKYLEQELLNVSE